VTLTRSHAGPTRPRSERESVHASELVVVSSIDARGAGASRSQPDASAARSASGIAASEREWRTEERRGWGGDAAIKATPA
jgi:hypothetical protein